jgi:hypothetical protein
VSDAQKSAVTEVSRANVGNGTQVTLRVDGFQLSGANQDMQLRALFMGNLSSTIPITVVEPRNYSSASPVSGPPSIGSAPNKVIWVANVGITIKDQFSVVLGLNWDGTLITESINGGPQCGFTFPTGDNLNAGTVNDPVSIEIPFASAAAANSVVNGTNPFTSPQPIPDVQQGIFADGTPLTGVNTRGRTLINNVWTVTNSH